MQGTLHAGIAIIAQLRRKTDHGGLADADGLAQAAGGHKGRLVIRFQDIVGDPLLPFGEGAHIFLDYSQNVSIHLGQLLLFSLRKPAVSAPYDTLFPGKKQAIFAG